MVGVSNQVTSRYRLVLPRALVFLLMGVLCSCELLITSALSISAYSPTAEFVEADSQLWLEYSVAVDHAKAESATCLKENGRAVELRFDWNGNRLNCTPVWPLKSGAAYVLSVADTVETVTGVNLDKAFEQCFAVRSEKVRPVATIASPQDGSVANDPFMPIVISFSEAVDKASFYAAFSTSPTVNFAYDWSADGRTVTARPLAAFSWQTDYLVKVSNSLADTGGISSGVLSSSSFQLGVPQTGPTVSQIHNAILTNSATVANWAVGSTRLNEQAETLGTLDYDSDWEADWGLHIEFSVPVKREGLESYLSFEPSWAYTMALGEAYVSSVILRPSDRLSYGSVYHLTVKKGLNDVQGNVSLADHGYCFKVNGQKTKPPLVDSWKIRLNPSATEDSACYLTLAGDHFNDWSVLVLDLAEFPVHSTTTTYIDLSLQMASGSAIDPLSLMQSLSLGTSNGCLIIGVNAITVTSATTARIWVSINPDTKSGLVTLHLATGFRDNRGNVTTTEQVWPVLK